MSGEIVPEYLSIGDLASELEIDAKDIAKLVRIRRLPHYRIGQRAIRFKKSEIPSIKLELSSFPNFRHRRMFWALELLLERDRFVYFIQSGGVKGPIKIGSARDVRARISMLEVGNPRPLTLLATARGGVVLEYGLHRKFRRTRIRGEWFRATAELKQLIVLLSRERTA